MKKIITCIGIRPDIIRLSLIIDELDKWFDNKICMSGQHYSPFLTDVMFQQMGIRKPDMNLKVGSGTQAEQIGKLMIAFEKTLKDEAPEFVVLLGDNNSTLGFALSAYKIGIPIVHVEGGMRSFDMRMPEERNRRLIDIMSDLHLVYLNEHRDNLIAMGIPQQNIFVVGNPIFDVITQYRSSNKESNIITKLGLVNKPFILSTIHRAENVDYKDELLKILSGLKFVAEKTKMRMIFIMMPRTKKRLEQSNLEIAKSIEAIEPVGFLDFLNLENNAKLILTDSGTVVEEAFILKRPCVTIRKSTERRELLCEGANILSGTNPFDILHSAEMVLKVDSYDWNEAIYGLNTHKKIAGILMGWKHE